MSSKNDIDTNLWIIPFADFMTILMIFFLALYVLSYNQTKMRQEQLLEEIQKSFNPGKQDTKTALDAAAELQKALADNQQGVTIEAGAKVIKIVMPAPMLFAEGSADISVSAQDVLDKISASFAGIPNNIMVEGHTDTIAVSPACRYRSNRELSAARAYGVAQYIIRKKGIAPERFVIIGHGENRPLKPNDSPVNRAFNRRVEISIER